MVSARGSTQARVIGSLAVLLCVLLPMSCARRGCGGQAGQTVSTDLISVIPFTESPQQTQRLDFGTPLGDLYLLAGWSETAPEGPEKPLPSVSYLRHRIGRLFFHLAAPQPRELHLRCAAFQGQREHISATFRLNGIYIGRGIFGREMSDATLRLPERAQRSGRNELLIRATLTRAIPNPIAEHFSLTESALACDELRVEGPGDENAATVVAGDAGANLVLPAGAAVDVYVQIAADSRLAVHQAGNSGGVLSIGEAVGSGAERNLFRGPLGAAGVNLSLAGQPGDIAHLHLRAGEAPLRLDRLAFERRAAAPTPPPRSAAGPRPNVILYVVDTLRADHLGCYGYDRPTSPHIDALARQSVLFEDAQAQAPWTRPSVASLMTGLIPPRHGAVKLRSSLGTEMPTLAEILHGQGYATAAWVTNMNVSPRWGFGRGFDRYEYLEESDQSKEMYQPAGVVHAASLQWLREIGDKPFFLYLHVSDVHGPYTPDEAHAARFERIDLRPKDDSIIRQLRALRLRRHGATPEQAQWLASLYDGEIAQLDDAFGDFIGKLRDSGVLDRAIFVFVADHGEEFLDHGGLSHGKTLYQELLHIPLFIRFPQAAHGGRRVHEIVQHVDIFATLLDALGIAAPADIDGHSVLAAAEEDGDGELRLAVSHTSFGQRELMAATESRWKVIVDRGNPRRRTAGPVQVYDRIADPREKSDLAMHAGYIAAYARQILAAGAAANKEVPPEKSQLDAATLEKLRMLGYAPEE